MGGPFPERRRAYSRRHEIDRVPRAVAPPRAGPARVVAASFGAREGAPSRGSLVGASPGGRLRPVKVLLLGATGVIGSRAAAELARSPQVGELVLTGRNESKLRRLAEGFDRRSNRLRTAVLDLTHVRDSNPFQGFDVVASCAGPSYRTEFAAAKTAVLAGTPYVSLCDEHLPYERARALTEDAAAKGCTIVAGCGLSPGLTNILVARACDDLDEVEEIDIALARSSAEPSGAASALHLLYELSTDAPAISDFQLDAERSGSAPKLVYFPEPVGWIETFRSGHPETVTLAESHQLRSMTFRIGLTEKAAMDAARAFAATGLGRRDRYRRLFVDVSGPVRPLLQRIPPRGPTWTGARVDVRGSKAGRSATVTLGIVDRLLNLAVLPLTHAALALGSGSIRKPGVHPPEEVFDHNTMLAELYERGLRVATLEAAGV